MQSSTCRWDGGGRKEIRKCFRYFFLFYLSFSVCTSTTCIIIQFEHLHIQIEINQLYNLYFMSYNENHRDMNRVYSGHLKNTQFLKANSMTKYYSTFAKLYSQIE